ncbi:glucose-1-phosphate cytidylyltransferase [Bradyrhizobium sp. LB7.1]
MTFDIASNTMEVHSRRAESWKVTLVETGISTMTGGRLKRIKHFIGEKPFCMTYGDGLADIDIPALIHHHLDGGCLATVTAVRPPGRFGALDINGNHVRGFVEKPEGDNSWINGGFFVLEPTALDFIDGDDTVWEREPLETLARSGQLSAYRHYGFWQPMDTVRDRNHLRLLWNSGEAPWKLW